MLLAYLIAGAAIYLMMRALGIGAAWLVLLSLAYGLWVRPGRDVPGEPEPS